ncbi:MAG: hypothetical protein LBI14_05985 [Treponema sp.]|jgi:hypothetical protein|nr:hypothetical protein [Treponema sp.]
MSKKAHEAVNPNSDKRFRLADLLIILLCLFGAFFFVNLFRIDLFSTLDAKNEKPVGTIIIKNNIVQRRMANRVLWDRLVVDSPAYMGDLIRTADISSATLRIESSSLELGEKTLIRIQRSPDGEGFIHIVLEEGSLGLSTSADGGSIILNLMGRELKAGPETILNVTAGKDGIIIQVSKGAAEFLYEGGGERREIAAGTLFALDADGRQREEAALTIQPRPNARYLKNGPEPLRIDFVWNNATLDSGVPLRLEIAEDRSFNRIIQVIENLDPAAGAAVDVSIDAGIWYWRLSSMEPSVVTAATSRIISTERFIVTEAAGPPLLSPVTDSLFRYQDDNPQLRFEWSEIEGASSYILEVSETPDFVNTRLRMQTASVFLLNSSLGQGTWYWRIMPVFPSVYEGSAAFSDAGFFRIEQSAAVEVALVLPELIQPEPVIEQPEPVIEPELVIEQPTPVIASAPRQQTPTPAPVQPTPTPRQPTPAPVQPAPRLPEPVPVNISLLSPSPGTSLPGLTALRQPTVFIWGSDGDIVRSRFILSRNSDPLQGQPAVEIINPDRSVSLNRLEEGLYYWTVEAQSRDGLISAAEPRQLRIMPIPLLPTPFNLQPAGGYRIGLEELRTQSTIVFSWPAVQGANAYIFTLYEETDNGRRIVVSRPPEDRTSWTLENLDTLGRGTFVWQVEAVNRGPTGAIEQHGSIGEASFIIDIPRPGPIQIEDPGTLYGY